MCKRSREITTMSPTFTAKAPKVTTLEVTQSHDTATTLQLYCHFFGDARTWMTAVESNPGMEIASEHAIYGWMIHVQHNSSRDPAQEAMEEQLMKESKQIVFFGDACATGPQAKHTRLLCTHVRMVEHVSRNQSSRGSPYQSFFRCLRFHQLACFSREYLCFDESLLGSNRRARGARSMLCRSGSRGGSMTMHQI